MTRLWPAQAAAKASGGAVNENNTNCIGDEFAWVPEWLSNPPPPTPAAVKGAEFFASCA